MNNPIRFESGARTDGIWMWRHRWSCSRLCSSLQVVAAVLFTSALVVALLGRPEPAQGVKASACDKDTVEVTEGVRWVHGSADQTSGHPASIVNLSLVSSVAAPTAQQSPRSGVARCRAELMSPVLPQVVLRKFDGPKHDWGPGHRGVDLVAVEGTPLLAPANGVISFAGLVAEKSVVSIQYRTLTLTFEPAQTELPMGTPVIKGMPFAVVAGLSDHCNGTCVHWGVRKIHKRYVDPVKRTGKRKIVLKPVG
jgi:hypothetical protein